MFTMCINMIVDNVFKFKSFSSSGIFSATLFEGLNFHDVIIEVLERKFDYMNNPTLDFDDVKLTML